MSKQQKAPVNTMDVGSAVFVRTVTHYYTGEVVRVDKDWLVLRNVAWIADTGRFSEALKTGTLNEIEPYPAGEVLIARGAIVDVSLWTHALPREMK